MAKLIVGKPEDVQEVAEVFRVWLVPPGSEDGFLCGKDHAELILVPEGAKPNEGNAIITVEPSTKQIFIYEEDVDALGWEVKLV